MAVASAPLQLHLTARERAWLVDDRSLALSLARDPIAPVVDPDVRRFARAITFALSMREMPTTAASLADHAFAVDVHGIAAAFNARVVEVQGALGALLSTGVLLRDPAAGDTVRFAPAVVPPSLIAFAIRWDVVRATFFEASMESRRLAMLVWRLLLDTMPRPDAVTRVKASSLAADLEVQVNRVREVLLVLDRHELIAREQVRGADSRIMLHPRIRIGAALPHLAATLPVAAADDAPLTAGRHAGEGIELVHPNGAAVQLGAGVGARVTRDPVTGRVRVDLTE